MAIPNYDEMYTVALEILSDGAEYKRNDIYDLISSKLGFTEEDKTATISSGQKIYVNRIGWTITYLNKAGLIERSARATYRITKTGLKALSDNVVVDNRYLEQFEGYQNFAGSKKIRVSRKVSDPKDNIISNSDKTPDEKLNEAVSEMEEKLIDDLLFEIKEQSPEFFENLVVDVIQKIYGGNFEDNHEVTPISNDGGIDGIIHQDRLGFNNIYIQAKKWDASVGRPELQKFAGAMAGVGAVNGAFITSSTFTKEAQAYVKQIFATTHIILIDGKELARLMIEYDIGVSTKKSIYIKRVDTDYFHPDQ